MVEEEWQKFQVKQIVASNASHLDYFITIKYASYSLLL